MLFRQRCARKFDHLSIAGGNIGCLVLNMTAEVQLRGRVALQVAQPEEMGCRYMWKEHIPMSPEYVHFLVGVGVGMNYSIETSSANSSRPQREYPQGPGHIHLHSPS